jgi:AraC family L-rhamnose operon regulatory protein RhaS
LQVLPVLPKAPADRTRARIILITGGTGSCEAGRRAVEVSMGHVIIVSPGYSVRFARPEELQMRVVSLDAQFLRSVARSWDIARHAGFKWLFPFAAGREPRRGAEKFRHFCLISQIFEQVLALAGEIGREIAEQHPGWPDLATGHFQHLCIALSRNYTQQRRTSLETDRRVAKAVEYIEKNFREKITVDELAHAAAMSKRSFYRLFRQTLGLTPNAHLKQVRLTQASEKLRLTEDTITEICYDCGFMDSNFFSREFRRTHGVSPTYYRRIWRA